MHIPDGYISPQTYLPLYGATIAFWAIALKKKLATEHNPYLAMAAAFSFF